MLFGSILLTLVVGHASAQFSSPAALESFVKTGNIANQQTDSQRVTALLQDSGDLAPSFVAASTSCSSGCSAACTSSCSNRCSQPSNPNQTSVCSTRCRPGTPRSF